MCIHSKRKSKPLFLLKQKAALKVIKAVLFIHTKIWKLTKVPKNKSRENLPKSNREEKAQERVFQPGTLWKNLLRSASKYHHQKQSLDKVAWEENLKVERTFKGGPNNDIYDLYYKLNPNKHHVWTNHLVIKSDIFQKLLKKGKRDDDCIKMKDLKKFNLECLDDPENHFYLKELGEKMGQGLFARHVIPASLFHFYYFFHCKKLVY